MPEQPPYPQSSNASSKCVKTSPEPTHALEPDNNSPEPDNDSPEPDNNSLEINVSQHPSICDTVLAQHYSLTTLRQVFATSLAYMKQQMQAGLRLPYYPQCDAEQWQQFNKTIDIYLTDASEGRQLNHDARGKDYATNILSYPSDLPATMISLLPSLPLGELVLCHEVVSQQADAQGKPIHQHVSHLLVHGLLHLLGFDHELGQDEQAQMEAMEIAILAELGIVNPYECP